jgi:hypothetical protein
MLVEIILISGMVFWSVMLLGLEKPGGQRFHNRYTSLISAASYSTTAWIPVQMMKPTTSPFWIHHNTNSVVPNTPLPHRYLNQPHHR